MRKAIIGSIKSRILLLMIVTIFLPIFSIADEEFVAIDLMQVELDGTRGVEPSPFIVGRDLITLEYFTLIMYHGFFPSFVSLL